MGWDTVAAKAIDLAAWIFRRSSASGNAFRDGMNMRRQMDRLIWEEPHLGIERIMILIAHNNGGELTPLCQKFVTAYCGACRPPFKDHVPDYQRLEIDTSYRDMLGLLATKRELSISDVEAMPDGMLKDLYREEGVKCARIFQLCDVKSHYIFCSFATSQMSEAFITAEHRSVFRRAVGSWRAVLKHYYKNK